MTRRGATALAGVLPIDKPAGMTSHDVVALVRSLTGEGRVGHAGTLDPAATGLLVVLVGPCTRLEPYLSGTSKRYEARIAFGSETDTDDAEGHVTRNAPTPDSLFDRELAVESVQRLVGTFEQVPPAYSAIKVDGRVAHREARAGRAVELASRVITVHQADLLGVDPTARTWDVAFCVSKGTYVRALARDIGRASGCAAHLCALRRTESGHLDLRQAHSLDEVREAADKGRIEALFADEVAALGMPVFQTEEESIANGRTLSPPLEFQVDEGSTVAIAVDGRLAGIYRVSDHHLVPEVVLPGRKDA